MAWNTNARNRRVFRHLLPFGNVAVMVCGALVYGIS
jgi:hypothetical protein